MKTCTLHILDEVNIKITDLDISTRRKIVNKLKYELPYARHMPAYKLGRWDGTKTFFSISGHGYLAHLDVILPIVEADGYYIEVVDLRNPSNLSFTAIGENYWADQGKVWPAGHPNAGDPIVLRNYQFDVVNKFLETPQSLQQVATGAGKCLRGDTLITINVDEDTYFGKFVTNKLSTYPKHIKITIGLLAEYLELFTGKSLLNCKEIDVSAFNITVPAVNGTQRVNSFIKKEKLPGVELTFNTIVLGCAAKHIFCNNGVDVFAEDLNVGDAVDTYYGELRVTHKTQVDADTYYDIGIDAPHLYYDSNGIVHHNTLTTATLSKLCEPYGRTVVIVPNKSLVVQTEEDYQNLGLDVGVYFGDRKELNKTHTICTWQSLNVLDKKNADNDEALSVAEFAEGVVAVIVDECFSGDTLIATPNGKTAIKDLKEGDIVLNLCEKTQMFKEDVVVKVHKNLTDSQTEQMLELEFDNNQIIKVTANHKFLTTAGWVRADELTEELEIINIDTYEIKK